MVSYGSVFQEIQQQRTKTETGLLEIRTHISRLGKKEPVPVGKRLSVSEMAREREQYRAVEKAKQEKVTELKGYESGVEKTLKEMQEQESKIKGYQKAGYQIEKTPEGYRFYKMVTTYTTTPSETEQIPSTEIEVPTLKGSGWAVHPSFYGVSGKIAPSEIESAVEKYGKFYGEKAEKYTGLLTPTEFALGLYGLKEGVAPGVDIELQPIKGTGYAVHPSYAGVETIIKAEDPKAYSKILKYYEGAKTTEFISGIRLGQTVSEYKKTTEVPYDIRSQVTVPPMYSEAKASEEYMKLSYEMGLGIKTEEQATRELETILGRKVSALPDYQETQWYKKYGVFEGGKTWEEIKQPGWSLELRESEPAIITPAIRQYEQAESIAEEWVRYTPETESYLEHLGERGLYLLTSFFAGGSADLLGYRSALEMGKEMLGLQTKEETYEKLIKIKAAGLYQAKQWSKEGALGHLQALTIGSPMVILAGMPLIGKGITGLTASVAPAYPGVAAAFTYGTGAMMSGLVGAELGYTLATEDVTAAIAKTMGIGTYIGAGYLGTKMGGLTPGEQAVLAKAKIGLETAVYKFPVSRRIASEIITFKETGRYGALQQGYRPPSELYLRTQEMIGGVREHVDIFKTHHAWVKQQTAMRKFAFEHPITSEQRARFRMFESQYEYPGGEIRAKPRPGYVLSFSQIARLTPRGGWLRVSPPEMLPELQIIGDQYFTKLVPTEEKPGKGYYLEYEVGVDIHSKPRTVIDEFHKLPYEYETMKGYGRIFKPDAPGTYTIAGKKVRIGGREAYDVFAGRKVLLREIGGRVERMGISETIYSEGKLYIPKKLSSTKYTVSESPVKFSTPVKIKVGKGLVIKTSLTSQLAEGKVIKTFENINQEWYKFLTFTKQSSAFLDTTITPGIGKTEKLYEAFGFFKGHKMEVSRYYTYGEFTKIRDVTLKPIQTGIVKSRGHIYDITEWFGSQKPGAKVSSERMLIFEQIKKAAPLRVSLSPRLLRSMALPPSKQIPATATRSATTKASATSQMVDLSHLSVSKTAMFPIVRLRKDTVSKTVSKAITKPATKLKLDIMPITKEMTKSLSKTITKPVTKSVVKTITKPATKEITKSVTKIATKSITKLVTKPITKLVTKPITKLVTRPITKPPTRPVPTVTPHPVPEPMEVVSVVGFPPLFEEPKKKKYIKKKKKRKKKKGARKKVHPVELLYAEKVKEILG